MGSVGLGPLAVDAELVARWQRGDAAAAAQVFEQFGARLVARFRRWGFDPATAEDLAQEVWFRFVPVLQDFDASRPLWPYLLTIARRLRVDHLRKHRTREGEPRELPVETTAEQVDPHADFASRYAQRQALARAFARLPATQHAALVAVGVDGLTNGELAIRDGCEPNAVDQRLHRARRNLTRGLRIEGFLGAGWFGPRPFRQVRQRLALLFDGPVGQALASAAVHVAVTASLALPVATAASATERATVPDTVHAAVVDERPTTDSGTAQRRGVTKRDQTAVPRQAGGRAPDSAPPKTTSSRYLIPLPSSPVGAAGIEPGQPQPPPEGPDYDYGVQAPLPDGRAVPVVGWQSWDEEDSAPVHSAACDAAAATPAGYCSRGRAEP